MGRHPHHRIVVLTVAHDLLCPGRTRHPDRIRRADDRRGAAFRIRAGGRGSADVLQEEPERDIPRRPLDHRAGHRLKEGRGADLGNGDDWRTGGTSCWASRGCPF